MRICFGVMPFSTARSDALSNTDCRESGITYEGRTGGGAAGVCVGVSGSFDEGSVVTLVLFSCLRRSMECADKSESVSSASTSGGNKVVRVDSWTM